MTERFSTPKRRALALAVAVGAPIVLDACGSSAATGTLTSECQIFAERGSTPLPVEARPTAWQVGAVKVNYLTANVWLGKNFNDSTTDGSIAHDAAHNTFVLNVDGLPLLPSPGLDVERNPQLGAVDVHNQKNTAAVLAVTNTIDNKTYELSSACITQTGSAPNTSDTVTLPVRPLALVSPTGVPSLTSSDLARYATPSVPSTH